MWQLRGRWGAAAKNTHEAWMCQPGWSHNPYEGKKKEVIQALRIAPLVASWSDSLKPAAWDSSPSRGTDGKKEKPQNWAVRTAAAPPHLAPSQAETPNRVLNLNYWESSSAERRLFIPLRSHPTRSTGSPTEHTHRCLKVLLSAGLSLSPGHTPSGAVGHDLLRSR